MHARGDQQHEGLRQGPRRRQRWVPPQRWEQPLPRWFRRKHVGRAGGARLLRSRGASPPSVGGMGTWTDWISRRAVRTDARPCWLAAARTIFAGEATRLERKGLDDEARASRRESRTFHVKPTEGRPALNRPGRLPACPHIGPEPADVPVRGRGYQVRPKARCCKH